MIRAKLETRHFTFEAYGETEAEALATLRFNWNCEHRRQYADAIPFDEFVADGDVGLIEIDLGRAYRDGELLTVSPCAETHQVMETMAADAKPTSDDDWGSERQIDAENAFMNRLEFLMPADEWETFGQWCLKATSEEMIDAGLALLEEQKWTHYNVKENTS